MFISYNDQEFSILRITDFIQQQIFTKDLTTYLWDFISIRCTCILNTMGTQPTFSSSGGTSNLRNVNTNPLVPSLSFMSCQAALKQPRKNLWIWQQDDPESYSTKNYVLQSPLCNAENVPIYDRDAFNGPRCIIHRIDPTHGNGSIWWDLEFQTYINNTYDDESANYLNPILANRYGMRVIYDESSYRQAYVYEGEAIFRTDVLAFYGQSPDQFRKDLLPPVLNGYQRRPLEVRLNQAKNALKYTVVDRYMPKSQPLNQIAGVAEVYINESRKYLRKVSFESLSLDSLKNLDVGISWDLGWLGRRFGIGPGKRKIY